LLPEVQGGRASARSGGTGKSDEVAFGVGEAADDQFAGLSDRAEDAPAT
jgi:hypothetical protein